MKKGDIVVVPFPFTDLSNQKRRPALVLFHSDEDVVLAFIITKLFYENHSSIRLTPTKKNALKKNSLIRIDKITTLNRDLIVGKLGEINAGQLEEVNEKMIALYQLHSI